MEVFTGKSREAHENAIRAVDMKSNSTTATSTISWQTNPQTRHRSVDKKLNKSDLIYFTAAPTQSLQSKYPSMRRQILKQFVWRMPETDEFIGTQQHARLFNQNNKNPLHILFRKPCTQAAQFADIFTQESFDSRKISIQHPLHEPDISKFSRGILCSLPAYR